MGTCSKLRDGKHIYPAEIDVFFLVVSVADFSTKFFSIETVLELQELRIQARPLLQY